VTGPAAPVDVGVIGLGFMGARWARALAEHPHACLRVVADLREDVGRAVADRWGATWVGDPLTAAAHPLLHGVVVCTPEHLHVDVAVAAIEAGKAVAVEKPLAHTVAAAERVRDQAAARDVPVLTGHILRFEPRYAAMARAVELGEIGAVQAVHSERVGLLGDQAILQGRTSVGLYYGVHEFDLARWYAGEVRRLYAERSQGLLQARGYEVEDLYSVVLRFASGAHGTAMIGWSLPDNPAGWGLAGFTVLGERGALRVVQGDLGLLKIGPQGPVFEDTFYSPEVHGRLRGALAIEVDHFIRCVQGIETPLCSAADGAEAVRLSLAMEESAATGAPTTLAGASRRSGQAREAP
jgi:predicted dehydrogenase